MLTDGIISYWKLDETSGNAIDATGTGNTLTNTNVTYSAGKINNGANFNVSNAYLSRNSFTINQTAFSISAWFKTSASAPSDIYSILCQDYTGGSPSRVFQFAINNSSNFRFIRFGSSNNLLTNISNSTPLNNGIWHHVVATFSNSVGSRIYVDGVLTGSDSVLTSNNSSLSIPTLMGASQGDSGSIGNYFNGQIDEVGIWSRALSGSEVSELYNGGAGLSYPFTSTFNPALGRRRLI